MFRVVCLFVCLHCLFYVCLFLRLFGWLHCLLCFVGVDELLYFSIACIVRLFCMYVWFVFCLVCLFVCLLVFVLAIVCLCIGLLALFISTVAFVRLRFVCWYVCFACLLGLLACLL